MEWYWNQLCIPEGLTCEYENHGLTPDNPGRKQAFCAKAWLTMFYHVIVGLNLDCDGLSFVRGSGIELVLRGLVVRGKTLDIELIGRGPTLTEVTLNGALSMGVDAFLQSRSDASRQLTGSSDGGVLGLTMGALVGHSQELRMFLNASQTNGRSKVISAPSVIATDNLAASITVGTSIPILTSQSVGGVQVGGDSQFTQTITQVQTGVTLSITPRVNASGIVTMQIDQEVSSPGAPAGGIDSPTIDRRNAPIIRRPESFRSCMPSQSGKVSRRNIRGLSKLYSMRIRNPSRLPMTTWQTQPGSRNRFRGLARSSRRRVP